MRDENELPADDVPEPQDLPAGEFASWLRRTRGAQLKERTADVPCGACTACCTSSYFIHIGPGESETLHRIPTELLFPAPGLPAGHVLMGYDEHGRCPMLVDGKCSIYDARPQTCRSYDCRVFPAAGIEAGGAEKDLINQRIRRWRFSYPTDGDRDAQRAVRAAATFLREHADGFPDGFVPSNPAQLAILAIKVYEVFVDDASTSDASPTVRDVVEAVIEKMRQFAAGSPVKLGVSISSSR